MSRYGTSSSSGSSSSSSRSSRSRRATGSSKKRKRTKTTRRKKAKPRAKKRKRVLRPPKPPKAKRWKKEKKDEMSWAPRSSSSAYRFEAPKPKVKRARRKTSAVSSEPRCGICGDPGDHGGDGHPYERWEDEERGLKVTPRAPSKFAIHQVLGHIKNDRDVLK